MAMLLRALGRAADPSIVIHQRGTLEKSSANHLAIYSLRRQAMIGSVSVVLVTCSLDASSGSSQAACAAGRPCRLPSTVRIHYRCPLQLAPFRGGEDDACGP